MSEPSERNPFIAAVFRHGVRQAVNSTQTGDLKLREPQTEDHHHEDENSSVPEGTLQPDVDPDVQEERWRQAGIGRWSSKG